MRVQNIKEFYEIGAKKVLRLYMSYDEIIHKPYDREEEIPPKFKSDVVFIGTWMRGENRDEFILRLIDSGINVSIWGDRWEKSSNWEKIKPFFILNTNILSPIKKNWFVLLIIKKNIIVI
jgi:hypothetical protein